MSGIECAILQRNVGKALDEIKKQLKAGSEVGEINNFYVETISKQVDKIQNELDKMEY